MFGLGPAVQVRTSTSRARDASLMVSARLLRSQRQQQLQAIQQRATQRCSRRTGRTPWVAPSTRFRKGFPVVCTPEDRCILPSFHDAPGPFFKPGSLELEAKSRQRQDHGRSGANEAVCGLEGVWEGTDV